MKRWIVAFGIAILGCLLILSHRASGAGLLADTDTSVLLRTIRQRNAPFSWFTSDWPLENHFYRPVSTLAFEMDNRLYGNAAWGYGLTNALLCVACTLLLFWFLREFTDSPVLTACGTFLFACWQTSSDFWLFQIFSWIGWLVALYGLLKTRTVFLNWLAPKARGSLSELIGWLNAGNRFFDARPGARVWVPCLLVLWKCAGELGSDRNLESRTVAWLPGRTALVMTVFALAALAAYARYERISAMRKVAEPGPLDPPKTKSASILQPPRFAGVWVLVAILCTLLALASYEQGVMVPALLLATACTFRWRGYRVRWAWQGAFWGCLALYLAVRHRYVPSAPSHYQLQQFRSGPGVWLSIASYTFPSLFAVGTMGVWTGDLPGSLVTSQPYEMLASLATDISTVVRALPRWALTFAGWGMSLIAFLPMAWVKEFAHYHYLPLALRSLFAVMLAWIAGEGVVSVWSPRSVQAPPRPDPAPGSLPRR